MAVLDIAWKAQLRLCQRYRRTRARGNSNNVIATAIAREMVGFIWAIACSVSPSPAEAVAAYPLATNDIPQPVLGAETFGKPRRPLLAGRAVHTHRADARHQGQEGQDEKTDLR